MKKAIILSGVSGSGKSTYASKLVKDEGYYFSADTYFMRGGVYHFDASKLTLAHAACFRDFLDGAQQGKPDLLVVDNTNTTVAEIAPYILGAQAFGYEPEIVTIMCNTARDVESAAARNTHKVPLPAVLAQHRRLKERVLPPWWKSTVRLAEFF